VIAPTRSKPNAVSKQWQSEAWTQLLAVGIGVVPLYSYAIVRQVWSDQPISTEGYTIYLGLIAPLSILIALLSLRYLCGENPGALNLRQGKVPSDLGAALILSTAIIVANVVVTSILTELFPTSASNTSVRVLFEQVADSPRLLVLFLGPLVFLGAASEEVIRAFLLSRVWKVWASPTGKLVAVLVSAGLFGLLHIYQGLVHVVWTSIVGLIMALYYLRYGRVAPMILAHYATNATYLIVFVLRTR
jgi:membrane protease YdiL (CAAX protease family)